jgi:hypothetical protein
MQKAHLTHQQNLIKEPRDYFNLCQTLLKNIKKKLEIMEILRIQNIIKECVDGIWVLY